MKTCSPQERPLSHSLPPFDAAHLSSQSLSNILGCSLNGLTTSQAKERLRNLGKNNASPTHRGLLTYKLFLYRFKNPLVLLLLMASLMTFLMGEGKNASIILGIVLSSLLIDFIQEYRAGKTILKLQKSIETKVTVLRDGAKHEIPDSDIVIGDVLELSAGDSIPADCYILSAKDFFVNQSMFTGESDPIEKTTPNEKLGPVTQDYEAPHLIIWGSFVISGQARALVYKAGPQRYLSQFSDALEKPRLPSAFESSTTQFGFFLMRLTIILLISTLIINLYLHKPWLDSVLFSIALCVGLTPELLPMILSVTFAIGAKQLAKQKIIPKQPSLIYDLGCMDVLCVDKTGTLTEGLIQLTDYYDFHHKKNEDVLRLAYLNSFFETGFKSPLDQAINAYQPMEAAQWQKLDEIPFDFGHKRIGILLKDKTRVNSDNLLIFKANIEDILQGCTSYQEKGQEVLPFDETSKAAFLKGCQEQAKNGYRNLGIAYTTVPHDQEQILPGQEQGLIFAGVISFKDTPKAGTKEAMRHLHEAGIHVKIITGDNEFVTQYLCQQLDVDVEGVLLGEEMANLTDEQLKTQLPQTNLFCRVTPEQKKRIVMLLRDQGHVVGFMGDGVNDTLALHGANVSISVHNAVSAAQAVADFILLEKDLDVVFRGVKEGRRTFANILKYIMMGTSSNFGNMLSMAGASLFLPFLPMSPVQVLLNNLLYDVAETTIPFDKVDSTLLKNPAQWDLRFIKRFMLFFGSLSSLFDVAFFILLWQVFKNNVAAFQTSWFLESILTQILIVFIIRTRKGPFQSVPARSLLLTSFAVVVVGMSLPFTPFGPYFGLVPIPPLYVFSLVGLMALYLPLAEIGKQFFYKRLS